MIARLLKLPLALMLLLCMVAGASAQTRRGDNSTWLPVWNNASGKLEAYLVLEPTETPQVGTRWRFGNNSLDTTFGLEAGDSLALLCNGRGALVGGLGGLPKSNCMLATLGDNLNDDHGSRRASATAAFSRSNNKFGLTAGSGRDTLPGWLVPGAPRNQVDVNDLTVFAQKNLRNEGFVSIAGTVAKARLVPASQVPELTDRWSSKSLTVGGGFGAFGASIVGHVVDTPGQPKWSGLGLGLTWRTPWSGQLTVGADNVVTRGKNPFSAAGNGAAADGDGTVPYVRYEQDL